MKGAAMQSVCLTSVTLGVSLPVLGTSAATIAQPPPLAASKGTVCVLALLIAVFYAGQAWADPISFPFNLTVQGVDEFFPGALSAAFGAAPTLGSTMQAVFTADGPRLPSDDRGDPRVGFYRLPGVWTFVTRSLTSTFNAPDAQIVVFDEREGDQFSITSAVTNRPDIRRFEAQLFLFGDESVFNSDKFPTVKDLLPMTGFLNVQGNFRDAPNGCSDPSVCGSDFLVFGTARIISGTPTPTPEPISVLLFGPAALVLAARQWRNRKHAN